MTKKSSSKPTSAQLRVLGTLSNAPITELGLTVYGIQRRTMHALTEAGMAKLRPHGKPPSWAITALGTATLDQRKITE
jgi:hypothetical protein